MPDRAGPRLAIGVDIGGTHLRVGLVGADGDVRDRVAERAGRDASAVLGRVIELCRDLVTEEVAAVGVGVPGRVDARRQEVLSGGHLDFAGLSMAGTIAAALGRPVILDNDCSMALLAELMLGAARGGTEVAMFTIGTGIGGALALGGRLVHGGGTAGQFGHIVVETDGLPCLCGGRGCVETTSSGAALGRLIVEAGLPALTRVEALLADDGPVGAGVIGRWVEPLAAAINSVVATAGVELVLLGGGLGAAAARALDGRARPRSPWFACPVRPAALGEAAGLVGAGLAALRFAPTPSRPAP